MPNSSSKIDYRLRPAKAVERKMFAEAFRRLAPFARIDSYRYIGFGALYFSDFYLFHKVFGFSDMTSIENVTDPAKRQRFEFNKPFHAIKMEFAHSNVVLPRISWEPRTIFWLDYDYTLNSEILEDISLIAAKVCSGSMLIVTVCIPAPPTRGPEDEGDPGTLATLKKSIGAEKMPANLTNRDFAGWGTAEIYRQIIRNQIQESLKQRNGVLSPASRMHFEQLFYFQYADGMKMVTVGGVFFDGGHDEIFSKCSFQNLEFYRNAETPYKIDPPLLTFREMRAIEKDLPAAEDRISLPIPEKEVRRYSSLYRYFPMFAETEIST